MKIEMEFQGLAELVKAFEKAASDDEIEAPVSFTFTFPIGTLSAA